MSPETHNCVFWPPAKKSFLAGLGRPRAQAMVKDLDKGRVIGMSYQIESERIYVQDKLRVLYFIQITGWDYTIHNESDEYPVLSFSCLDLTLKHTPPEQAVQNVRVFSRPVRRGYRIGEKTLRAGAYLMRQIEQGIVPDAQHVLGLYKVMPLHPLIPGFFQSSFSTAGEILKNSD